MSKFKGTLRFTKKSDEPCFLFKDGKVLGKGVYMLSTGQIFKVRFRSEKQYKYARVIQGKMGSVKVLGKKEGDYIMVDGLSYPLNQAAQARKIHKIREAQAIDTSNQIQTGHQRSGDAHLPLIAMDIQVLYKKPKKDEE